MYMYTNEINNEIITDLGQGNAGSDFVDVSPYYVFTSNYCQITRRDRIKYVKKC